MTETKVTGEISFDCLDDEEDTNHIEGIYRVSPDDWKIFYFTKWINGGLWQGDLKIRTNVVWLSGIGGIEVHYPSDKKMNRFVAKELLSKILGDAELNEVHGPDSLQMK